MNSPNRMLMSSIRDQLNLLKCVKGGVLEQVGNQGTLEGTLDESIANMDD
jgi:hypothetical protein